VPSAPFSSLARWLRDRDLQHETESGLNVVENYNGVNDYTRFGSLAADPR
jgi:TnpA family transposase